MEKLRKLLEMEDDHNGEAECWLMEGVRNPILHTRITCLQSARDSFKKAGNTFFVEATEDELKLIKYQQKMESKFNRKFANLSVNGTMKLLLQEKEFKLAEELKKEFKVPDSRFWFAKITVLSEMHEFVELEKFSKSKKSPIGYEVSISRFDIRDEVNADVIDLFRVTHSQSIMLFPCSHSALVFFVSAIF